MARVRGFLLIYEKFFVGFKKSWLRYVESRQSKSRTVSVKNSRFRHVESRRSNSVPGDQEEMWRYGNSTRLAFKQKVSNGKRERTSYLLARSGFSNWPRKQVTVYLIRSVLKTSCSVEVNKFNTVKERGSRQFMKLSHAAVRIHERGSWWWLIQRWIIVKINWLTGRPGDGFYILHSLFSPTAIVINTRSTFKFLLHDIWTVLNCHSNSPPHTYLTFDTTEKWLYSTQISIPSAVYCID